MDQIAYSIDNELIKKTNSLLTKKIMDILISKKLPFSEIRDLASGIVEQLPLIKDSLQFKNFLDDLVTTFPIFKEEAYILNEELKMRKEKEVMNKLKGYIKNFSSV